MSPVPPEVISEDAIVDGSQRSNSCRIAGVVIGRNEGLRLKACLETGLQQLDLIIYVDSGSTDDSLEIAAQLGVPSVILDNSTPFTAARARNLGWREVLRRCETAPDAIQFVDGDCSFQPGWIAAASDVLARHGDVGIVTGWRSERHPEASVYNALCDFEWRRPAGEIRTCGGDMLVRAEVLTAVNGFRDDVIAAEDDEFCARVRMQGWRIWRTPVEMTSHDAAMHTFQQWWQRAVRTGHGFAQVGFLHEDIFVRERQRVWVFGALLPVMAVLGGLISHWLAWIVLSLYLLSYVRSSLGLMKEGLDLQQAGSQAVLLTLSKFPNLLGLLKFHWRRIREKKMELIEYK